MHSNQLYYTKPAEYWMEALPLGNGSIGAMCYSGVKTDEISLNHDTLWTGRPREVKRAGAFESYKKAQRLALDGHYVECNDELAKNFLACWTQAYLTFGTLKMQFDFDEYTDYRRTLDLSSALLHSTFSVNGKTYTKTAFVSHPHQVLVYKIHAENGGRFSFDTTIACPLKHTMFAKEQMLIVDGECPGDTDTYSPTYPCSALIYSDKPEERGVLFRGAVKIDSDGETVYSDHGIQVKNASYAVVYFHIRTSYNGFDKFPAIDGKEYKNACIHTLQTAYEVRYDTLKENHVADFRSFYNRVSLDLGESDTDLPTDERLQKFAKDKDDNTLYMLLFNFGKYLLISSSRSGSTATNLQGIWNNSVHAPWNSNYTVNINTQMNYWPALPCNMPEMMMPLVDLMKAVSVAGEKTAKDFYHANGFVMHHNTDIWGHTAPVYGAPVYAFWSGGSGWLCRNLYEMYEYSLDKEYLRETAFPIMKKAAEFYLDILVEDENKNLIVCPATSPENFFVMGDVVCPTSKSTAMMNMVVLDLFINCKKACEVLQDRDAFYADICKAIGKIKPLEIGENGAILEWNEPMVEAEVQHRHVSHLYALHPAGLITSKDTELWEACKKTLEIRGDVGTGWSLAWKVNFWARLRDGNHALKLIDRQLNYLPADESAKTDYQNSGGTYPNMLDAHPPFQIDGNFGVLSGICEMLLQSDAENVYLLPALPDKWKNGCVKGLAARGNVTVDMKWSDGKITEYQVHGEKDAIHVVVCR